MSSSHDLGVFMDMSYVELRGTLYFGVDLFDDPCSSKDLGICRIRESKSNSYNCFLYDVSRKCINFIIKKRICSYDAS